MKPNIFEYENYRDYLKDMYAHFKKERHVFSFRFFAREAGLQSPNYLKLVMDGERNLGRETIPKFIKGLKLNRQEAEFFHNLIAFTQAASVEEKQVHYERMARNQKYRQIKELERDKFKYYSHWYIAAVRELVLHPDFKNDPKWIAERLSPKITVRQARAALNLLFKLKLIQMDDRGKITQVDALVSSGAEVRSLAVKAFHREMLGLASQAIDRFPMEERDITGIMVMVPENMLPILKQKITKFRRDLLASIETKGEKADRLYQFYVQLFPLMDREEKK